MNHGREMTVPCTSPAGSVREALEKAHGQFCLIAATNCWTHNNLQGWQESPGALREFAEEAAVADADMLKLADDLKRASESLHRPPSIQCQKNIRAMNAMDKAAEIICRIATPRPLPSVEDLARLIDPDAFKMWQDLFDYSKRDGDEAFAKRCADHFHKAACDEALAKATAILTLLGGSAR